MLELNSRFETPHGFILVLEAPLRRVKLPFKVVLLVLDPILLFDQGSGLLFELISDLLSLLLLFSDPLACLLQFDVFLPKKVDLSPELMPHCLVLLHDSFMVYRCVVRCLCPFRGALQLV